MTRHRSNPPESDTPRWIVRLTARGMLRRTLPHEDRGAAEIYDRHGRALHLLACALTPDTRLAESFVAGVIVAQRNVVVPNPLHELAAAVHSAWAAAGSRAAPVGGHPLLAGVPIGELHELPDSHRVPIALCTYGGQTYRQAAATLDLPPQDVARLLGEALRMLALPTAVSPISAA